MDSSLRFGRAHPPRVLSPVDVALLLGVSVPTARQWLRAGRLGPVARVGRRVYVLREDLLDALAAQDGAARALRPLRPEAS